MQKMERMDTGWEMEKAHLEKNLATKNMEVENLQKQLKELNVQFAKIEIRMEEVMLGTQRKNQHQEIANLKNEMEARFGKGNEEAENLKKQVLAIESKMEDAASLRSDMKMECKAEVKKELDNVLMRY